MTIIVDDSAPKPDDKPAGARRPAARSEPESDVNSVDDSAPKRNDEPA